MNGSATFYNLDISSENINRLSTDVDGKVISFGIEAGAGLNFETELPAGSGTMTLHGAIDLKRLLKGNTQIMINSDNFESEGPKILPLLDGGISWTQSDLIIDANLATAGIGSDNFNYSGSLRLQYLF